MAATNKNKYKQTWFQKKVLKSRAAQIKSVRAQSFFVKENIIYRKQKDTSNKKKSKPYILCCRRVCQDLLSGQVTLTLLHSKKWYQAVALGLHNMLSSLHVQPLYASVQLSLSDFYSQLTCLPWRPGAVVPGIRAISISRWHGCWAGLPPATGQLLLPAQLIGWQVAGTKQVCLGQEEEARGRQVSRYLGPKIKRLLQNENKSYTQT